LQSDKARYYILKIMVDGEWHNLTSLLRVAKKYRPIGLVGVGMALNSLQASIGCDIFENETEHESSAADIVDSSWKIKDDYMGILRAVVSSMDGSPSPAEQTSKLTSTLERMQLQKAARAGQPGTESQ
nr:hypothetical protein [Candidatus Sigynarchaeota archaeon]